MSRSEEWRAIPGYEGLYEASSMGRVRSLDKVVPHLRYGAYTIRGKTLKLSTLNKYGHLRVGIYSEGRQRVRLVHHLVLETFVGPRPEGACCRHLDGDPGNNRPENLKWGTMQENSDDRVRHGNSGLGEARAGAKHKASDAILVAKLYVQDGMRRCDIIRATGYGHNFVYAVTSGKTWGSATGIEKPETGGQRADPRHHIPGVGSDI